jgi:hypothetical protein
VVARRRIAIVRVVRARTVVGRRRIVIAPGARTEVGRRRIVIARVVRVRTRLVAIPIVAAGAVRAAKVRTAGAHPPIGSARVATTPGATAAPMTAQIAAADSRATARAEQALIAIVRHTTNVVTSEIVRRLGRLITIAHAQTVIVQIVIVQIVIVQIVIVQTVPAQIAILPMGNVRAAKARIVTGRRLVVPPAVELPTAANVANTRIAVARRANGRSDPAAAGHPASEHREPAGIGQIKVRDPRTDRSAAHRGSTGRIARGATTRMHRAVARIAGTDRRAAPTVRPRIASTRIASTRTARTRIARVTGPTNAMPRAQTAAVRTTIVPGARRVTGRGATTAGTTGRAGTTAAPAVPIIPATTGQPARERTSVSART